MFNPINQKDYVWINVSRNAKLHPYKNGEKGIIQGNKS